VARRLRILLVDALVLAGLAAFALMLLRAEFSSGAEAKVEPDLMLEAMSPSRGDDLAVRSASGEVVISALVAVDSTVGLILPGDHVDVTDTMRRRVVFEDIKVLAIDPRGESGAESVRMTFSLPQGDAELLKALRQKGALEVTLRGLGADAIRAEFEPPRPNEIVVKRFANGSWQRRVAAN